MKLWIIYKEGIVISKYIAEMIQDRLEDYVDTSVGNANKIEPSFLVEEKFNYLIIGDIISETIPSLEIQNWVSKYGVVSKANNLEVKALSGFYVALNDTKIEPFWVDFIKENIRAEILYPPILSLKLKVADLTKSNGVFDIVRSYSNDFIEFLINNKKKKKN